jgi:hypothetical protein
LIVGLIGAAAAAIVVTVPPLRALAGAVVLRATLEGDTGRMADEWSPVVESISDEGLGAAVHGVGAGRSFVTGAGQERTYIHNVVLYGLYYSGIPGAGLWLLAYGLLGLGLFKRGWSDEAPELLALASLVVALFVYGQFFAVHKLLSYNLLLMLAVQGLCAGPRRSQT